MRAAGPGRILPPEKDQVPIVQEAGRAPGPIWTGAENLATTGIQSPDRPARSQSLYRLRYPAYWHWIFLLKCVQKISGVAKNRTEISCPLHEDLSTFVFLTETFLTLQ